MSSSLPASDVHPAVDEDFAPYTLIRPQGDVLPLVGDSPHSGTHYPADFRFATSFEKLRSGEDTYVHELWRALPEVGGTLLAAQFPRSYIDPNRDADDIDAALLEAPWPTPLRPTEKTRLGHGLIWRDALKAPIYDRKLSVAEVQSRIDRFHAPYHQALAECIEAAYARSRAVWHLNLHSMPANSYEVLELQSDHPLADFVLGDRDGTTCSPAFMDVVATALRARGYSVAINDPFKGVALIGRLGRPAQNRHSIQIEVQRPLYMNEETFERSPDFATLQADMAGVLRDIAAYIKEELQ